MQRALDAYRAAGGEVRPDDVARLSPLGLEHLTIIGRYQFLAPESVRRGELLPLRAVPSSEA
jgi:hypothetical protein